MTHDPVKQRPFEAVKDAVFPVDMYYVAVMVTGDIARDLLLYNKEPEPGNESTNRKASPSVTVDYSVLMLKGEWYLSPQPIIISECDPELLSQGQIEEMIDGQQRLKAVVLASQQRPDIAVPFMICFDAPSAAKWLLDMGKKRQPGDFLRMQGEISSGHLARALRVLYALLEMQPYKSINLWRHVKLTPQEQAAYLAKHASLRQGLEIAQGMKTLVMPHIGAVLFYLMATEYGVWTAQEFFNGLASGAELKRTDPRLILREFISAKKNPIRGGVAHRWDGFEQLALLLAAANAWLLGDVDYKASLTFNKLNSRHYPRLLRRDEMPTTVIVPGNDPSRVTTLPDAEDRD